MQNPKELFFKLILILVYQRPSPSLQNTVIFKFYNPILEPKSILPVLFPITAFKVCYIFNIKIRNLYGEGWITFWENHIEIYYRRSFLKLKRSLNGVNILLFKAQRQLWEDRSFARAQRWWITSRNNVFRTQQVRCTGELAAIMTACTSPMESWGQTNSHHSWGGRSPSLTEKILSFGISGKDRGSFLLLYGYWPPTPGQVPYPKRQLVNTNLSLWREKERERQREQT